jgi:hypothetical protein
MKTLSLLLLLTIPAFSQKIKGEIKDAKTGEVLPFVNVFISNTTKGTATDTLGLFELSGLSYGTYTVVASMVGFEAFRQDITLNEASKEVFVEIQLKPLEQKLEEIAIKSKRDKRWENDLKEFRKIFLGISENVKPCQIKDEYLIDFERKNNNLIAQTERPIEIENRALGYKISFVLKRFEASKTFFVIAGDAFFEELIPSPTERELWRKNRTESYRGSMTHFLQSLARKTTADDGFEIYQYSLMANTKTETNNFSHNINAEQMLSKVNQEQIMKPNSTWFELDLSRKIEVHYTQKSDYFKTYVDIPFQVSQIESVDKKAVRFNQNGIFEDKYAVVSMGSFNNYRLADMLPTDFQPAIEDILPQKIDFKKNYSNLQERIQIHTNKSNYKTGETIWFKTYQAYTDPIYRDAISKVVYVELLNEKTKIIANKILKSKDGIAWGDFDLNDTIRTGNYYLRAYTNWMRNFGDSTQAILEIPVFQTNQVAKLHIADYQVDSSINLVLNKTKLKKGESLKLDLLAVPNSSYSIAITHQNSTGFYQPINRIQFIQKPIEIEKIAYPSEVGLTFFGNIKNANEKPISADLMVVRKDSLLVDNYKSDKKGNFIVENMQGNGKLIFDVIAYNEKGKPLSNIEVNPPQPPDFYYSSLKKVYSIETNQTFINQNLSYDESFNNDSTIALAEIAVKAKKKTDTTMVTRMHKIFGKPTYGFTDKNLRLEGRTHFIQAIQGKVAGLEVFFDASTGKIFLRSSKHGDWQPAISFDGIMYEDINDLSWVVPSTIARIDVYRTNSAMIVPGRKAGLIAIYTKTYLGGDEQAFEDIPAEGIKRFRFDGFYTPKSFKMPDFQEDLQKMATFENRTTIYWNPDVKTDNFGEAKINLQAIGKSGKYRIEVVGYDAKGNVTKSEAGFEIE